MHNAGIDLLAIDRGLITSPAGCGKTQLIATALTRHHGPKPVLVLTHTNAGVVALRERLSRAGVAAKSYRLSTLDGWAMRLISTFPMRSGHEPDILQLKHPASDYPNIRIRAAKLLGAGHIADVIAASYDRLIVDEYQDCTIRQHALVAYTASILPTCVLGDPLQAIFGFGSDRLANWQGEVCTFFKLVAELDVPWRWINAEAGELGLWLLECRNALLRNDALDLGASPDRVRWVELDGTQDHVRRLAAMRVRPQHSDGSVLVLGDSTNPKSQRMFASQTPGAVAVEAVDLKDLITFARKFDVASADALECLADFAACVITNVNVADYLRQVRSATSNGVASVSEAEQAGIEFARTANYRSAVNILVALGKQPASRAYRPELLRACIEALNECERNIELSFLEAVIRRREENRLLGRSLPKRAVGSTLLLKGLEADTAVILNADVMDAHHLYVALTRASRSITVCSSSSRLPG